MESKKVTWSSRPLFLWGDMHVRKFNFDSDFKLLNKWLVRHGHAQAKEDEIPLIGFVVEYQYAEIVMLFLRNCAGNMAIAESLVSDPDAPLCRRVKAIDLGIETLCEVAKNQGIKYLLATTESTGVLARISKRHGFIVSPQTLLVKSL